MSTKSNGRITIRLGAGHREIHVGNQVTDISVIDQLPRNMQKRERDRLSSVVIADMQRRGFFRKDKIDA